MNTLVDAFGVTASASGAVVHVLTDAAQLAPLITSLAAGAAIAVAPVAAAHCGELGALGSVAATDLPVCTRSVVGVTRAVLGVAETGSVLVSEPQLEDRLTSAWTDRCIVVVSANDIVESLITALVRLEQTDTCSAVLISGPSRTADIERSLTVGVQGPRAVDIAVLP